MSLTIYPEIKKKMSLPIDDRLMGERVQCYISDDEDEIEAKVNQLKIEKNIEKEKQN